jgi:hypothetical protein
MYELLNQREYELVPQGGKQNLAEIGLIARNGRETLGP